MELELDKLSAVRVLGKGAMGTVFLVIDRSDHPSRPPVFALKVVEKHSPTAKPDADRRARWELSVLSRLGSHHFLPSLLGSLETPDLLAWAVPFCPGGDLNALRYSLSDRIFSPAAIRFYVSEIVSALAHLHSLGIVYRDLKPENVLLQASGHVTLTDFDLSRHLAPKPLPSSPAYSNPISLPSPPENNHRRRRGHHHRRNLTRIFFGGHASATGGSPDNTGGYPDSTGHLRQQLKKAKSARVSPVSRRRPSISGGVAACERSHSFVGTEEYVSPEVVRGDGHEFAVDWWALGILTYEMTYGRTPFRGRNRKETFRNVLTRQPEFAGRQRADLTDLIARLLAKDPVRRLGYAGGAEEVKAHPFFRGVQWDLLADVNRPPFLAPLEDLEEEVLAQSGDGTADAVEGFDIRDYCKRLREQQASPAAPSPFSSSVSLAEF
ncbi:serine/threonine-protein kinase UCN-like [Phoenix dactylifera]|uniref:non-specific serine/threonine protein kinase n=1 Tax=Phoenix dactylifera TaxID=42345 RepID=A0A8B7MRT8_PHODC|nr:serine/threonine-protein kinase UCN-like [Phoenix dactylifera]